MPRPSTHEPRATAPPAQARGPEVAEVAEVAEAAGAASASGGRDRSSKPLPHLFSAEGEAALAALLQRRPLMAFDFDGTLAPIVARPDDARPSQAVLSRLRALCERLPVAIITGRALGDVRERLGCVPRYLVGSHGAEDADDPAGMAALRQGLDGLRERLQAASAALARAGVQVEDKGLSLALHYRLARDRGGAQAVIQDLLAPLADQLQLFGGKMVVNAMAAGAPDKAQALHKLVLRSGAGTAFYVGDDVNDEPVFVAAAPHWLTVRIGRSPPASRARFALNGQPEMPLLLQRVLGLLDGRRGPAPGHSTGAPPLKAPPR